MAEAAFLSDLEMRRSVRAAAYPRNLSRSRPRGAADTGDGLEPQGTPDPRAVVRELLAEFVRVVF